MIDQLLKEALDLVHVTRYWEAQADLGYFCYLAVFDHWQMENGRMEWPDA